MEESEKRRERLKVMRMEAAQTGVNYVSEISGLPTGGLSNPLVESETTSTTPLQHYPPRFDYYTDPMAAFSGNRRGYMPPQVSRGNFNMPPHVSQGNYNMPPQVSQGNYNMPPQDSQGNYNMPPQVSGNYNIPPGYIHHAMPPRPAHQNPVLNSSGQRAFDAPRPQFNQVPPRSPGAAFRPFSRPQENPPGAWGGSSGRYNYSSPPNLYQGDRFTSPGFVQGESPVSGRGRGQRYTDNSHYHDSGRGGSRSHGSGRGRGQWAGTNTSRGPSSSSGKGAGSHGSVSAALRPDLYYSKQMVQDPWQSLVPVIWKGVEGPDSKQSWLPKSISSTKKAKVSPESSNISIPQPSLAEYLAASFNDSTDEAVDDEQSS